MEGRAGHFELVATTYDRGRPPYPPTLYDALGDLTDSRVLELGAGSGQATSGLIARGARVTAVEPGPALAAILAVRVPQADVVVATAEEAAYPSGLDLVACATAWHWLDHAEVLPRLHTALRPGGRLAVWRTVFGDPDVSTPFRDEVTRIAEAGGLGDREVPRPLRCAEQRAELERGGWFVTDDPLVIRWSTTLSTAQVHDLFTTFSPWTPELVDRVAAAADACGGEVEEHYVSVLHVARRADDVTPVPST